MTVIGYIKDFPASLENVFSIQNRTAIQVSGVQALLASFGLSSVYQSGRVDIWHLTPFVIQQRYARNARKSNKYVCYTTYICDKMKISE